MVISLFETTTFVGTAFPSFIFFYIIRPRNGFLIPEVFGCSLAGTTAFSGSLPPLSSSSNPIIDGFVCCDTVCSLSSLFSPVFASFGLSDYPLSSVFNFLTGGRFWLGKRVSIGFGSPFSLHLRSSVFGSGLRGAFCSC